VPQQSLPKIDILMTILKRLDAAEKLTAGELSRELAVTERSVYRYLDTLQSAGYPIYFDRKLKSYRFVESYSLPNSGSPGKLATALDLKRQMLNSSPIGIAAYRVDGTCIWANEALAELIHATRQQALAQNFNDIDSWRESGLFELVLSAIRGNEERARDVRMVTTFGKELWAHCIVTPFSSNGERFIMVMAHDISARKQHELALSTFVSSVSKGPNLLMITDLNGVIEYVSDKITEVTGFSREEVVGATPRIFQSGLTPASVYENMWETISAGLEWTGELCNRRKSGSAYWEHIRISPIFDADNQVTRFVAVKEDVTRHKLLEEELYRHATGDSVTGLYNRRMTRELATREMALARRGHIPLALVMIDIDGLKNINVTFGHAAGDDILRAVAQACRTMTQCGDLLGRTGGDEFLVVLTGVDTRQSLMRGEQLRKAIEDIVVENRGIRCTASIGVAMLTDGDQDFDEVLARAGQAAYQANRQGKNRVVLFTADDRETR
jgi:diguanylate cyclase (GGDEF)-like protein/PAS domain S-box-containing protein